MSGGDFSLKGQQLQDTNKKQVSTRVSLELHPNLRERTQVDKKSAELFEEARLIVPGGVHSAFRYQDPHPRYFSLARGAYVWDVDGNRYIDCIVNMGACILGHGDRKVLGAVREQLDTGLTAGLETELGIKVATLLHNMIPSAEAVKFSNTGTEAVMHAIQIARGFSGRNKIAKLEGGYNGWYDYALVSTRPDPTSWGPVGDPVTVPGSAGLAKDATTQTIVLPFNNIEDTVRIIRRNANDLAAVLIEPVLFSIGCVAPKDDYLKVVRETTEEFGIILILDEVVSGFRMAPGGGQEYYGVKPDMSVFGKAIANGFPLAAVVGRREIMDVTDPKTGKVVYAGTYNANQISLAASLATLNQLKDGRLQKRFHSNGQWLKKEFEDIADAIGIEAHLLTLGGQFQAYFTDTEPIDYRTAMTTDQKKYAAFRRAALESGVLMHGSALMHHGITSAHNKSQLKAILEAMRNGLKNAKLA